LLNEAGGLRLQRIPPTERKGRVHTSTVTVAIIDPTVVAIIFNESDCDISWFSGTGAGGQNRNKVMCSCRLTHRPTGIVRSSQTRSRITSYATALKELENEVTSGKLKEQLTASSANRKQQVGSGMRGDKIRTIRFQDDTAVDHLTGKKTTAKKFMSGNMDLLW